MLIYIILKEEIKKEIKQNNERNILIIKKIKEEK